MLRDDPPRGEMTSSPLSTGPDAGARTDIPAAPVATPRVRPSLGFKQFVAIIAALMAVNALAIDSMLPALSTIAKSLGISTGNQQQWIVTAYLLGFGAAQIIYGTLADRFGRKTVMLTGLAIYVAASLVAMLSTTLEMLIAARLIQGVGSAATRVLAVSVVRDCYSGPTMARVMSLSFIVFLAVPILAPSIGQLIMLVGPWRWIFGGLALFGFLVAVWTFVKLPETLHPEDRLPISIKAVSRAYATALSNRVAVGYMLSMTAMLGALFGFINSAQQIFVDVFKSPGMFTTIFASVAFFMALASFLNSRVVEHFGSRRVSHVALLGFIAAGAVHAVLAIAGYETLLSFAIFQAGIMFCFGLCAPNFGSLAMGPLGHVAGTASSIQGFVTTVGGALLGFFVGQHFNGSVVPLTLGYTIYGLLALAAVMLAEKGRLFGGRGGVPTLAPDVAH